jgi:hypothetical protein
MTSEECRLLIPQYLSGQLTALEHQLFDNQVGVDDELRLEVEELGSLWEGLGSLPQEQPSAALRGRFYERLNGMQRVRSRPAERGYAWWKPGLQGLVPQAAVAVTVFLLGTYVGRVNPGGHDPAAQEVKRLDTEVQGLRQTVAMSLMDRQSANSRLEGISWISRVEKPDGDLVSALLTALNRDPNTNVRLAALDALEKFAGEPAVRKALVDGLSHQDSPLVQIALIDALVHIRDGGAAGELRKLSGDTEVNAAVRQRAQWGLQRLNF